MKKHIYMKRITTGALAVTMLFSLAACNNNASKETTKATQAQTEAMTTGEAATEAASENAVQPFVMETAADKDAFLAALTCEDLPVLYKTITITGTKLSYEQVYSMKDLITLAGYCFDQAELADYAVTAKANVKGKEATVYGLDLVKLLKLAGADLSEPQRIMLTAGGEEAKFGFGETSTAMLVLSVDGKLLENGAGILVGEENLYAEGVDFLMFGSCCDNPHYEMHNREPHNASADITFTFNVYEGDALKETVTYTTLELENMALDNPSAVYGSYYGIIGNSESIKSMGSGGYMDYYEGLRFDYLLSEKLGITDFNGSAELYSREGEVYATIEDLAYFTQDSSSYYMCTKDGDAITGLAIPVLAYAKNGSPLLPEHEHDTEAYVAATPIKEALKAMGMEEVGLGTVKNHSGPFVAALGDCDGYYGGYQTETSGDCIRMDIHLK